MMKNLLLFSFILFATLLFAYEDSDFDGVDDTQDRCPNTPFTELVDINGCGINSLVKEYSFDIVMGMSYSDSDYQTLNTTDTLSSTLQLDYYYKNFSLQASTSYFTTEGDSYSDTGLNDSYLTASYQFDVLEALLVSFGAGIVIPTYQSSLNNNEVDYLASLNLSYNLQKVNVFGGVSYTFIGDEDTTIVYDTNSTTEVNYQDTLSLSVGLGYYLSEKIYLSGGYNFSESIYKNIQEIETLSFYAYYEIDEKYFTTFSYAYGVSDSASKNYLSLRLGYQF